MSFVIKESFPDIRDLSLLELKAYLIAKGEKSFRAAQIFAWIYKKNAVSFDDLTNVSQALRQQLKTDFIFQPLKIAAELTSEDGTRKFLFDLKDTEQVESVLIPTAGRTTACISTQVGCKFGCKFCASGIGGWKRNLSPSEIVAQVLHVKKESTEGRVLSHIVFMGIGEPLDNYDNLIKAVDLINSKEGIGLGARKITVSTSGVVPKIKMLAGQDVQLELAISLHGYDNPSRNVLMPVNKKYPIEELMAACREYAANKKRVITFEYILIKGVTVTPSAVASLKKLFSGIKCKMNLIPYNKVDEFDHICPSMKEMKAFQESLEKSGIHATIRTPRGRDVGAACGQLRHSHKE